MARKAARGAPPRSPRVPQTSSTQQLIIIGRDRRAQHITSRLERLRLRTRRFPDFATARPTLSATTCPVVLVEPLPESRIVDILGELLTEVRGRLSFVIVPESYSDRRARKVYEAGATAVFAWPREALVLPAMMSELLKIPPRRGNKRGDEALARAVRARLALADDVEVSARIVGGTVILRGRVNSYWKKTRLVDMLSQLPGVLSVHCERIDIVPVARPDAELRRDVRNVLRSVADVDGRTISVSVDDGIVDLEGTVLRHGELARIINVVGNIQGVRSIRSHVNIATSTDKARGTAGRLRKKIATMVPSARASVTVFGYIAILDGHVSTLADKHFIEELARDTAGIGRVVNKLLVTR